MIRSIHAHLYNSANLYFIVLISFLRILSFLSSHQIGMLSPLGLCLWCPFSLGYILQDICVAYSFVFSMTFWASLLKIKQTLAMHVCIYSLFVFFLQHLSFSDTKCFTIPFCLFEETVGLFEFRIFFYFLFHDVFLVSRMEGSLKIRLKK